MKGLVAVAFVLLLVAIGVAVYVSTLDESTEFEAADAEAVVRRALERCDHPMRRARRIECDAAGGGFSCRADGRFVAEFDEPDPDQPRFSLDC